jgi:MFS family permease
LRANSGIVAVWNQPNNSFVCIGRTISGIGSACTQVSSLALLSSNVIELNSALGIQEIFNGLGFIFGPPLGGAFFVWFGLHWSFFLTAIIVGILLLFAVVHRKVQSKLWIDFEAEKNDIIIRLSLDDENEKLPGLPAFKLLNFEVILLGLSSTCLYTIFGGIDSILAPHLQKMLNIGVNYVGMIYSLTGILYAVCSGFISRIIKVLTSKVTLLFGLNLVSFSLVLIGPIPLLDHTLNVPVSWIFIILGSVTLGFGMGMGLVPALPMIIQTAERLAVENKEHFSCSEKFISNSTSAILNTFVSVGQVLGPLSAGILIQYLPQRILSTCVDTLANCLSGMQWTMFIFALISSLFSILIIFFVPNYEKITTQNGPTQELETS